MFWDKITGACAKSKDQLKTSGSQERLLSEKREADDDVLDPASMENDRESEEDGGVSSEGDNGVGPNQSMRVALI